MLMAAAPVVLPSIGAAAELTPSRCIDVHDASARVLDRTFVLGGTSEIRVELSIAPRADALVYAVEKGVDAEIEVLDRTGATLSVSDNPVARSGVQRAWLPMSGNAPAVVVVRGHEHAGVTGSVRLLVVHPRAQPAAPACAALEKTLASGDAFYASARMDARPAGSGAAASPRIALESAQAQYENAIATASAVNRMAERGDIELAVAALNYYGLQDWANSAKWAEQAAATLQKSGDAYAHARAQAVLAAAWIEIATKSASSGLSSDTPTDSHQLLERARALLAKLEKFHAGRGEHYDRALQINNIGLAWLNEARFEPALAEFTRALEEFNRLRETQRVAVALQNMALCEWGLGRLSAALPRFNRALSLMTPQPYPDLYLATLYSNGLAHYAAGEFDESLRLHGQGLDLASRLQLDRARGRSYYGMGVTYYAIGDRDLAARFLGSALELLGPDVDARARVAALRSLAVIEHERGRFAQANAYNSEALRLATAPSARARILLRLAAGSIAQGQASSAMRLLEPLIAFPPNGDALIRAQALVERARLRRSAGELAAARRDVVSALEAFQDYEALTDEFEARVELAHIEHAANDEDAALKALARALALTGEIMSQTANPEYRASIADSLRPALDLKIDLLWRRYERASRAGDATAGRAVALEALRTADNSRALAFDQVRAQRHGGDADPGIAQLQRRIAALYRDLAERRFQLSSREDRIGANDAAARRLREDIARLRAQLGVANSELAARSAPAGRGVNPSRAEGIAGLLGSRADAAFIEYWVGGTHTYSWVLARGGLTWERIASSEQVERVARALHESMRSYATTRVATRLEQASALYRLIVEPMKTSLAGARDLTIVPDGPLHYVPFGTLRDVAAADRPYLIQRYSIALAPALRLIGHESAPRPRAWAESRMLLVADPVYEANDPRLVRAVVQGSATNNSKLNDLLRVRSGVDPSSLERLISSAREAERIRSLPGIGRVDLLEGLDATRPNFLARNLENYRFIHIASHGITDSEIPQISALILGGWGRNGRVADQYVRAGDLMTRTFDAEVVVLSACDTALGREFAGEGLIGLRYAALARGARSVVGSLWPVSDAMGADLMTDMYRYITAGDGQRVPVALASAIRSALARAPSLDPALWGPFAAYVAGD
jgi:CHAT domain-containing protein